MPWCPKCRRFQEDDDLCAYCWVETVDKLEPEPDKPLEEINEVLLITVSDENEATIIQELLKVNKIPSLRKHRGIGNYLQISTGMSIYGIDIFVAESQFEQAREILTSYKDSFLEEEAVLNIEENLNEKEIDVEKRDDDENPNLGLERKIKIIVVILFILLLYLLSRQSNLY